MKLWLLKVITPWRLYDVSNAFVVRAESKFVARRFASLNCGDEGRDVWFDDAVTSCEELTASGAPGLVLRDFTAG